MTDLHPTAQRTVWQGFELPVRVCSIIEVGRNKATAQAKGLDIVRWYSNCGAAVLSMLEKTSMAAHAAQGIGLGDFHCESQDSVGLSSSVLLLSPVQVHNVVEGLRTEAV